MRRFVWTAAMLAITSACQPAPAPPAADAGFSALVVEPRTLAQLAADIQAKTITSAALTQAFLDRIAAVDDGGPMLNAVLALNPNALADAKALDAELAAGKIRGPLHGVPILLKDNIETLDPMATTAGSLALQDNRTGRDAPLVARLRAAGAVILGKTNLSEWANFRSNGSTSGWSAVGGQTRNPHALNRNTCGSSSGSGAAVAAGMVTMAVGTETDGSITCPASVNGIVGFKPTVGMVSRTHVVPISHSQDTAGPMTRTVREAALLLGAMAGSDPADPATAEADKHVTDFAAALSAQSLKGARIGVMRFATGFGTDGLLEAALKVLRDQGATLVDITKMEGLRAMGTAESLVLHSELKADLNAYLATTPPAVKARTLTDLIAFNKANAVREMALFEQETFEKSDLLPPLTDPAYLKARADSLRIAGPEGIDRMLAENKLDALVGPTMPPAWPIDAVNGDQISGGGAGSLAAVAGYPHLTVLGANHPKMIQISAAAGVQRQVAGPKEGNLQ